jgi:hypothetical protein
MVSTISQTMGAQTLRAKRRDAPYPRYRQPPHLARHALSAQDVAKAHELSKHRHTPAAQI